MVNTEKHPTIEHDKRNNLLLFSFFLNFPFFFPCSFSSSETISGGSWRLSWGGDGSPVRYKPGNLVGLISSELGVRARLPPCSTLRCSLGLLVGGRKHSVILTRWYHSKTISCYLSIIPAKKRNRRSHGTVPYNVNEHTTICTIKPYFINKVGKKKPYDRLLPIMHPFWHRFTNPRAITTQHNNHLWTTSW